MNMEKQPMQPGSEEWAENEKEKTDFLYQIRSQLENLNNLNDMENFQNENRKFFKEVLENQRKHSEYYQQIIENQRKQSKDYQQMIELLKSIAEK